jgi:hypothetical protein
MEKFEKSRRMDKEREGGGKKGDDKKSSMIKTPITTRMDSSVFCLPTGRRNAATMASSASVFEDCLALPQGPVCALVHPSLFSKEVIEGILM